MGSRLLNNWWIVLSTGESIPTAFIVDDSRAEFVIADCSGNHSKPHT